MCDRPTVLAVAVYADKASAETDVAAVWGIHRSAGSDQLAAAILEKDADGRLRIDRLESTATDPAWGGVLVGGALAIMAAPLAIVALSGVAAQGATWPGIGGVVGYFWDHVPKGQLRRMSDLLELGQAALVIVAVDRAGTDIEPLLQRATDKIVVQTDTGDVVRAYDRALA